MSRKTLLLIIVFIAVFYSLIFLSQNSAYSPQVNDDEDYQYLSMLFNENEIDYIITNNINIYELLPYLEYENFNLYNFFSYEELRHSYNLSILESLNLHKYPNFFNIDTINAEALFLDSQLILVNKSFYLSSDFVPKGLMNLANTEVEFIKRIAEPIYLNEEAVMNVQRLFSDAKEEGINFIVFSGYRDYQKQFELYYYVYKQNNQLSAKPGHSEHQTGLALDISTLQWGLSHYFANTKEFQWLSENAHRYGFILRFPADKEHITGYIYEPWHYRYVGTEHAKIIYDNNLCLEEYLFKYFELS